MNVPIDLSTITIETRRLLLRPFMETDLADFYAYASVPGVGEMAGWPHHESIEASAVILRYILERREAFAVVHKVDRKVIGSLGLHRSWTDEEEKYRHLKVMEIGFALSKDYWGRGLMAEAVKAVIRYCFDTVGLDAIVCGHFAHNNQSRRVIEKCGFSFIRQDTRRAERLGRSFDHRLYLLTRVGWQAGRNGLRNEQA